MDKKFNKEELFNIVKSAPEGETIMGYEHENSRGQKYYLHSRGKLFFFSKKPEEGIDLPFGFNVVENERTGLPMLKRK